MVKQVTASIREAIVATKVEYDSLNQAIKIAKAQGADAKAIRTLIQLKDNVKANRLANDNKLLKAMPLATNVVNLEGSWYAVRYTNEKNDLTISVEILNDKDVPILQRDGRSERELSQRDLNTLVPGCIDEAMLEMYKQSVVHKANEYVYDYCSILVEQESVIEVVRPTTVSAHSGMRYVQRKLRIGVNNESVAEDYRRSHLKEVEAGVLEGYSKSEQVWVADDGMVFSFDEDNIMYVVGDASGPNNIVTLYEEDFGFSKEINRSITFQQLEVLKVARESLRLTERELEESLRGNDEALRLATDQIEYLQCQIDELVAQKDIIMSKRELFAKSMKTAKSKYSAEFNKLFMKWSS